MMRLNEKDTTMTSTTSRRSFMKYAAAMGAALVLPAGVAIAHENESAVSPMGEIPNEPQAPTRDELAAYTEDEVTQLASNNATEVFRSDFAFVAEGWTQAELAAWVSDPGWHAERHEMQRELYDALAESGMKDWRAEDHAQFIIWAMESHAAGYTPEQCRVAFLPLNGKRVMSLVWSTEGFSA